MIGVSKLLCGTENFGDKLRYVQGANEQRNGASIGHGPVVVWNCTKTCNLQCIHCYANSDSKKYQEELTTKEAKAFIDDLHEFKVPVILFSGGEPLIREDIFELIEYANKNKIRSTISTNGTLIDKEMATRIKQQGVGYVGVSLDGIGSTHDEFRRTKGCFDKALNGIRNCRDSRFSRGCLAGTSYCIISPIGDVQPCAYLNLPVGNVRETPFSEIWNSNPIFQELRTLDYKGKCGVCKYKHACGGCRARVAFYNNGDYMAGEKQCLYTNNQTGDV